MVESPHHVGSEHIHESVLKSGSITLCVALTCGIGCLGCTVPVLHEEVVACEETVSHALVDVVLTVFAFRTHVTFAKELHSACEVLLALSEHVLDGVTSLEVGDFFQGVAVSLGVHERHARRILSNVSSLVEVMGKELHEVVV